MGLLDKIQPKSPQETPKDNLEKKEIEFILNTIKNSSFKGEDLDILYRVVVKLQNQYIKLET
jgi:hypothetical protein